MCKKGYLFVILIIIVKTTIQKQLYICNLKEKRIDCQFLENIYHFYFPGIIPFFAYT